MLFQLVKKQNLMYFLLIFIFFLYSTFPIFSLDTTEAFEQGLASDFEFYYTFASIKHKQDHIFELVSGSGISKTLSISISVTLGLNKSIASYYITGPITTTLFWNVFANNNTEFDIISNIQVEANTLSDEKNIYPNFVSYSSSFSFEWNLITFKIIQPYILGEIIFHINDIKSQNNYKSSNPDFPIALGLMTPLYHKIEFFLQYGLTTSLENITPSNKRWTSGEQVFSSGLNIILNSDLEMINEFNIVLNSKVKHNWSILFGFIYTRI